MASALIRIDQAANSSPIGMAGKARDDILVGAAVTLRNADDAGVKQRLWTLVSRPYGSSASITNPKSAVATLVPDVYGSYLVKLEVNENTAGQVDLREVIVRDPAGLALPSPLSTGGKNGSANYAVSPGVYNEHGWAREMNQRQLRCLDTRAEPLQVKVGAGAFEVVIIDWGLPMAIMESLEITTTASTDTDVAVCVDLAGSLNRLQWNTANLTGAGRDNWIPLTLAGPLGAPLEFNGIYIYLFNNDVDSTYSIYTRIKAP